jgi:hypothetical protein
MKRKLFLLLCALLTMIGVQAQVDVTASYIGDLNAYVKGGWEGNCGNNHAETAGIGWWNTQKNLSGGHSFRNGESWCPNVGSAGVMIGRTMVLPAGNYTLAFEAYGATSANATTPTAPVAGEVKAFFSGSDIKYDVTNTVIDNATYHPVSYTFDVATDNTAYTFGVEKISDGSTANWARVQNITLTLNSTDITAVANNSVDAFTYTAENPNTWHTNTWSTEGQSDGSRFQVPFHELWRDSKDKKGLNDATIDGSYTPTQSGVYKVSAWVRAVNEYGSGVSGVSIYVGDVEADACSGSVVMNGKGRLGTYTAMADGVAATPIAFGFRIKDATANWLAFKNVVITYLGNIPQDEIDALLDQVPTDKMSASVQTELNSKVNDLNTDKSVAAYNALASYIPTANASVSVYENIATLITTYQTKASALDAAGQAAYDASAIQTKYDDGTYETESEAEADLQAALAVAAKAQTTNGADMTDAIVNHSFEDGEYTSGWTTTKDGDTGRKLNSNATYTITNPDGDYIFNTWSHGYPLTQNIGTLRAGYYKLSATVASDGATLYLLANNTHPATGAKTTDKKVGLTAEYLFYLSESTDNVNIGVVGCNGNYAEEGNWWYKADNFRLTYYSSLPDAPTAVDGVMKSSIATAQSNAISAYNSSKTVENYNAAAAAVAEAEASVAAYANALTYLEKVEEVLATTNFYTTTAYDNVYGTYKTAYDERTLDNVTGRDLSYKVAGSGGTQRYDSNTANDLLIPGWKIGETDATTIGSGFYVNTWSNEGNTDGSNVTNPFYEYWTASTGALTATNLVASISGYKPNTSYRISALVRVQQQNDQSKAADDLTFKVGSGVAVNAADGTQIGETSYYYKNVIATGSSDAEGNLAVTFNVKEGNHISWVAFKNITVEELADDREVNLLFNADFEEPYTVYAKSGVASDRAIYVPNGWTINGTFNTNDMTIFNSGDKASSNFSSITALPTGENNTFLYRGKWGNNTTFDVFQNITLPAGTYKLSCDAWKSGLGGDGVIFADTNTASLSSNETYWRPLSLEFTLNEETSLNVGFRVIHNNDGSEKFIGFDNFGLYTVNKVDEDVAYTPVDKTAHSVIVKRTIKEGVNTVVFPFSMTQDEVEAYFGAGSVVYELSSYENGTIHFTTKEGISANEPCLVKATSTAHSATDYELTDRTLVSGTPTYAGEGVTMTGTYAASTTIDQGNYIVSGSNIYLVNSDNVKMKNTRAYITLGTPNSARELILDLDGEVTSINAIEAAEAEANAQKDGKYLIGNKIVIVKNGVKYDANGKKLN